MSLRNSFILSVRWHRRIGLLCILFVFVLSVTGILLNHTTGLALDRIKISNPIVAKLYGLTTPQPLAFPVAGQWVAHDGINQLYLNKTAVGQCNAPLLGAVMLDDVLHLLCHQELLLFTQQGQQLESITPGLGLPANAQALTQLNHQLLVNTPNGAIVADIDSLSWRNTETAPAQWPTAQTPPPQLNKQIRVPAAIDLEQLLLDLHSGRLFGQLGVWAMDIVALLLIVLSVTGFIAWNSSRRIKKTSKRK